MKSQELLAIVKDIKLSASGIPQNSDKLVQTLAALIAYDTTSSHNANECQSNVEFVTLLKEYFKALGATVQITDAEYPQGVKQQSFIARIGPDADGGVVLCGHTDVVSVKDQVWAIDDPFILTEKDGKLFGRGATDMKGALAQYLAVAASLEEASLNKPVYFAFTWGEELSCIGSGHMAESLNKMGAKPDMMIVGEPTDETLIVGHKGSATVKVNVKGRATHSSQPEQGLDANSYMGPVLAEVNTLKKALMNDKEGHDHAFSPPHAVVNPGVLKGGNSPNTVSGNAELTMHVRTLPQKKFLKNKVMLPLQEQLEKIQQEMQEEATFVQKVLKSDTKPEVGITLQKISNACGLPSQQGHPLFPSMLNLYKEVRGRTQEDDNVIVKTAAYGTDAGNILNGLNHDPLVIIYGPGNLSTQHAHSPDEYVTKQQLLDTLLFPAAIVAQLCIEHEKRVDDKHSNDYSSKTRHQDRLIQMSSATTYGASTSY